MKCDHKVGMRLHGVFSIMFFLCTSGIEPVDALDSTVQNTVKLVTWAYTWIHSVMP